MTREPAARSVYALPLRMQGDRAVVDRVAYRARSRDGYELDGWAEASASVLQTRWPHCAALAYRALAGEFAADRLSFPVAQGLLIDLSSSFAAAGLRDPSLAEARTAWRQSQEEPWGHCLHRSRHLIVPPVVSALPAALSQEETTSAWHVAFVLVRAIASQGILLWRASRSRCDGSSGTDQSRIENTGRSVGRLAVVERTDGCPLQSPASVKATGA